MNQVLNDYARALRHRWRWLAWGLLLGVAATTIALLVVPPKYYASATVFVRTPGDVSRAVDGGDLYARERAPTYAALNVDPARFGGGVTASVRPNTVLIDLSASASDPDEAQRLAADYLIAWAEDVKTLETVPGSVVPRAELVVVDPPRVPTQREAFGVPVAVLLAGAALTGLVLAAVVVVIRAIFDRSLHDRGDVERLTGLRTLGPIECERDARAVGQTAFPRPGRVLLVTGTEDGHANVSTAAALASAVSTADEPCTVVPSVEFTGETEGRLAVVCASPLTSTDIDRLAPHADAIVLVVPLETATADRLRRACELLPPTPSTSVVVAAAESSAWQPDATTEEKADVP